MELILTSISQHNSVSPVYMNEVSKSTGQNSTTARAYLLKLNQIPYGKPIADNIIFHISLQTSGINYYIPIYYYYN